MMYICLRDVERTSEWQEHNGAKKPNIHQMCEADRVRALKIKAFTMSGIDERGIGEVITESLDYLKRQGVTHLHVSFDLDSIDPIYAPGVGTPVPGGLNYREAHLMMESIATSPML